MMIEIYEMFFALWRIGAFYGLSALGAYFIKRIWYKELLVRG